MMISMVSSVHFQGRSMRSRSLGSVSKVGAGDVSIGGGFLGTSAGRGRGELSGDTPNPKTLSPGGAPGTHRAPGSPG